MESRKRKQGSPTALDLGITPLILVAQVTFSFFSVFPLFNGQIKHKSAFFFPPCNFALLLQANSHAICVHFYIGAVHVGALRRDAQNAYPPF